jgi:transaldolase
MTQAIAYKSSLHKMTQTTPTSLWNDSASIQELAYSIEHGAVGATCNPVMVLGVMKKEISLWSDRIQRLVRERPTANEDEICMATRPRGLRESRNRARTDLRGAGG